MLETESGSGLRSRLESVDPALNASLVIVMCLVAKHAVPGGNGNDILAWWFVEIRMATPRTRLGAEHAAYEEENLNWMIPGPTGRITGTLLDNLGTFCMQAMLGFEPSQRIALLSKVPRDMLPARYVCRNSSTHDLETLSCSPIL